MGTPTYDPAMLDAPLWHVELPGSKVCVAESAEGTFLVLFTSPARAYDFVDRESLGDRGAVSPTLWSVSRAEFFCRASTSAAGGARGVVVDPAGNGRVGSIIEWDIETEGTDLS
jgi:hypothetical protein